MKTRRRHTFVNFVAMVAVFGPLQHARGQSPSMQSPAPEASAEPASVRRLLQSLETKPGGLTPDRVAERVVRVSPDLEARREEVLAAAAAVDQARIAFIPKLTVGGLVGVASEIPASDYGNVVVAPDSPIGPLSPGAPLVNAPFSIPAAPTHRYAAQASLNVPLSDYLLRTRQALSGAENNQSSAEVTRKASTLSAAVEARVLYYNWVRGKLQLTVAEQTLHQSQDHLRDVNNSFEAGQASRADVLSSESQLARSELLLERAKNLVAFSEQQLRIAMHDASGAPYAVGESVFTVDAAAPKGQALEALQSEALQARLEPRALQQSSDAFKEQAKVANAGIFPRLDGVASVVYANPNTNIVPLRDGFKTTWLVGVQATWEVNGLGDAAAARRGFEARAGETEARRAATEDAIRTEVSQYWQALQDARAAVQSTARSLAASEEAYRVRRELFQNGRASNVELEDAETDLTSSRFGVVDAQIDLRIASLRLAHATGRDVFGSAN
ncbi:MAG TPA: TolC family protein [Myxococcaceae bacterium]|nr:TolC family protein [Myxococcaceae bacterium]